MKRSSERAKKLERLIRLTWSSLESHLKWTHQKTSEGITFHKKCVKDYSETIKLLSDLY